MECLKVALIPPPHPPTHIAPLPSFPPAKDAAFSKRIGTETEVEVIGGADKYVAVCRECFLEQPKQDTPRFIKSPTPGVITAGSDTQRKLFSSP